MVYKNWVSPSGKQIIIADYDDKFLKILGKKDNFQLIDSNEAERRLTEMNEKANGEVEMMKKLREKV